MIALPPNNALNLLFADTPEARERRRKLDLQYERLMQENTRQYINTDRGPVRE